MSPGQGVKVLGEISQKTNVLELRGLRGEGGREAREGGQGPEDSLPSLATVLAGAGDAPPPIACSLFPEDF